MKLAAIDIGTNTTRLLIADVSGSELTTLTRRQVITRLGEGVDEAGRFKPAAVRRTVAALEQFAQEISDQGVDAVRVAATSAARDAENGAEFIDQLKKHFGWDVAILSGEQEGMLAFLGATSDFPFPKPFSRPVLLDVGGGSTELACGTGMSLQTLKSFDIGSVRLTEMFVKHDPPTDSELAQIRDHVAEKTDADLAELCGETDLVAIGVAGTITTLAAIKQKLEVYDPDKIHLSKLAVGDIERIIKQLKAVPLSERRNIPGLEPKRADVIIAGAIITLQMLNRLELDEITVSEHDLLDGLVWTAAPGVRARTI